MQKHDLKKSLQDYLSKIKKSKISNMQFTSKSLSFSKKFSISSCNHVRTISNAAGESQDDRGHGGNGDAATLSDIDRFLFENFRSLYVESDDEFEDDDVKMGKDCEGEKVDGIQFDESPRLKNPLLELCGSNRFFVNPCFSGNLMEESRLSLAARSSVDCDNITEESRSMHTAAASEEDRGFSLTSNASTQNEVRLPNHSIAILKYSPSPYGDFRTSMREMVEAKMQRHGGIDWDFMEQLLFCYLNLNEKKSHEYILSAFADLIVVMRQNSDGAPASSRNVMTQQVRRKK